MKHDYSFKEMVIDGRPGVLHMRFIADAMLGRLAKWMRIMGCDVAYYRRIGDRELVNLALKDSRMILTKDTLLIQRQKATFFWSGETAIRTSSNKLPGSFLWTPIRVS